ncbi:MAG TPA: hypothetical protein G4O00_03230 [Thermoflexia bacterium]|nr:hypothetical protein [Thermoflexia bacterium]
MGQAHTPTPGAPPRYFAYLLRCWEERGREGGEIRWRFSLEDPHTGQRWGFEGMEAMVRFLRRRLAEEEGGRNEDGGSPIQGPPR